jgi:hypothetical protein
MAHRILSAPFVSKLFLLAGMGLGVLATVQAQTLVINEFDSDQAGEDNAEFIELYGLPNTPLNGFVLVIYNGSTDAVYSAWDLTGNALDASGYFVAGGPNVPGGVDLLFPVNHLQNGPEAIALFDGDPTQFAVGTPVTNENLLDAVVYGNNHPTDQGLRQVLTPGGVQVNESANGQGPYQSCARIPNGGEPFQPGTFVAQNPTPGSSNVLTCSGGTLALAPGNASTVCSDIGVVQVGFVHTTDVPQASVTLVLANAAGQIQQSYPGTIANFSGLGDALISVWAVSHDAPLLPESLLPGSPLSGVSSGGGCISLSYNSVQVTAVTCDLPSCDGGNVTDAGGTPTAMGCFGYENAEIAFGYTSEAVEAEYLFVVTDGAQQIMDTVSYPLYDFNNLGVGTWQVWGVSALGGFVPATLAVGGPLAGIQGVECDSLSASALTVQILACESGSLCTELFISEYVEGTSNNKAIEIYNPTPFAVDLAGYRVETWNNGAAAPTNSQNLTGTLEPEDVFVLVNALAVPALSQAGDLISQATWFNGNDVIRLVHDDVLIDQMGELGTDPQGPFTVDGGEGAMAEFTLVRKANVSMGTTDWSLGQEQWEVYPQNTFDFIGYHNATCDVTPQMQVGFAAPELFCSEGGGVAVAISVDYPLQDAVVQVSVVGGTAVYGEDYPGIYDGLEFLFPVGLLNDQVFTFAAIDEEEPEFEETVELALTVLQGDVAVVLGYCTIHILPSDLAYPVYDIVEVRGVNATTGVADSLGVACELRGIVHGWNDYPSAFQFTLIDATSGINVFSPVYNFGYAPVTAGDSVRVRGVVNQFGGLIQLIADTLIFEGSGFAMQEPALVTTLGEHTESRMIRLKCAELVNPAQWTNALPSFVVDITTGSVTYQMRVDANTDLWGQPAPQGVFGVTGIGDQVDFTPPYFGGYRISPRGQDDLSEPVQADFTVTSPWTTAEGPLELTNLSEGAGGYFWSFGNGANSQDFEPSYAYPEAGVYTIYLTANSMDGLCSDQASAEVEVLPVGVAESLPEAGWRVAPNPVSGGAVTIEWQGGRLTGGVVRDAQGRWLQAVAFPGASRVDLPVDGWAPGMYLLELTGERSAGGVARATVRLVVAP